MSFFFNMNCYLCKYPMTVIRREPLLIVYKCESIECGAKHGSGFTTCLIYIDPSKNDVKGYTICFNKNDDWYRIRSGYENKSTQLYKILIKEQKYVGTDIIIEVNKYYPFSIESDYQIKMLQLFHKLCTLTVFS